VAPIVGNGASSTGGSLTLDFEVATDPAFVMVETKNAAPGAGGQTLITVGQLGASKDYYWRVKTTHGSDTAVSKTFVGAGEEVDAKRLLRERHVDPRQHIVVHLDHPRLAQDDIVVAQATAGKARQAYHIGAFLYQRTERTGTKYPDFTISLAYRERSPQKVACTESSSVMLDSCHRARIRFALERRLTRIVLVWLIWVRFADPTRTLTALTGHCRTLFRSLHRTKHHSRTADEFA
jgi:hypothetical protein